MPGMSNMSAEVPANSPNRVAEEASSEGCLNVTVGNRLNGTLAEAWLIQMAPSDSTLSPSGQQSSKRCRSVLVASLSVGAAVADCAALTPDSSAYCDVNTCP
jgi:hypothetical protein